MINLNISLKGNNILLIKKKTWILINSWNLNHYPSWLHLHYMITRGDTYHCTVLLLHFNFYLPTKKSQEANNCWPQWLHIWWPRRYNATKKFYIIHIPFRLFHFNVIINSRIPLQEWRAHTALDDFISQKIYKYFIPSSIFIELVRFQYKTEHPRRWYPHINHNKHP